MTEKTSRHLSRNTRSESLSLRGPIYGLLMSALLSGCFLSHHSNDSNGDHPDNDAGIEILLQDASSPLSNSTCGNGLIESAEVCDDGNTENGDTCSSDCTAFDPCPDRVLYGDFQIPNRADDTLRMLEECTVINGNLIVKDGDLKNLDGLENIVEIEGDLTIGQDYPMRIGYDDSYEVYDLEDIKALRGLTSVGGNLTIGMTALQNLEGLNQLRTVGGDLIIFHGTGYNSGAPNNHLTSLQGLNSLVNIGGSLIIEGCGYLEDVSALGRLETIGGDLRLAMNSYRPEVSSMLEVFAGPPSVAYLTNLDGFESLKSVQGHVEISGKVLSDLNGLGSLETVGRSLWLTGLAASDLTALNHLISVADDVIITGNDSLQTLFTPDSRLTIGGDLYIAANEQLPSCQAHSFKDQITAGNLAGEVLICSNQEDACGMEICPGIGTYPYPGEFYHRLWIERRLERQP